MDGDFRSRPFSFREKGANGYLRRVTVGVAERKAAFSIISLPLPNLLSYYLNSISSSFSSVLRS